MTVTESGSRPGRNTNHAAATSGAWLSVIAVSEDCTQQLDSRTRHVLRLTRPATQKVRSGIAAQEKLLRQIPSEQPVVVTPRNRGPCAHRELKHMNKSLNTARGVTQRGFARTGENGSTHENN